MAPHDRNPILNRDFILGLLLGIILHVAFTLLWLLLAWILGLTVPLFQAGYNFILLGIPVFFLSITQIIYLLPGYIAVVKGKPEIGKGLIGCAILTIFTEWGMFCDDFFFARIIDRDCWYCGFGDRGRFDRE